MSKFVLSDRSRSRLTGVHPRLVAVVERAIQLTNTDFTVLEGLRTTERQRELFNAKPPATKTMKSKHLKQADGFGHAVDLAPVPVRGQIPWEDKPKFWAIRNAMFAAAHELGVGLRWGGDWNSNGRSDDETFYDGPHFEIKE